MHVHQDDAVLLSLKCGLCRTNPHAGWVLAVVAEDREKEPRYHRRLPHLVLEHLAPEHGALGAVFGLAGDGARMTADTSALIYELRPFGRPRC